MRKKLSLELRRELLTRTAEDYASARKGIKSQIVDQLVAATGYGHKHAITLLNHPPGSVSSSRPRRARYDERVKRALVTLWTTANRICAKRLVPFLPELIEVMERNGHLCLPADVRRKLLTISPATADRLLASERSSRHGLSTTRPGSLLKKQIKVRTFADWDDLQPGFLEADLVAHCGESAAGSFLHTLVLVDVATGWTECVALLRRSEADVIGALNSLRGRLPVPLLGLDTDNGSEFINYEMLRYCQREQITFTRSRVNRKNDQAFVEEKNGSVVRRLIGYDRYEGLGAWRALIQLYEILRLYVNFFQPSMKLIEKQRDGARVKKRYDRAQTPYQRVIASAYLTKRKRERIERLYRKLDPVTLLKELERRQDHFWTFANGQRELEGNDSPRAMDAVVRKYLVEITASQEPSGIRRYRRTKKPRTWRTRKDPFAEVWPEVRVQLEVNPAQTAKALFVGLQQRYPGRFFDGQLRTLQRRVLAFGNPGSGKTHLVCALGQELILLGRRVLFSTCALLVQRLLRAKIDLTLEKELKKLDRFEALIVDDIGYVQQSREEMEVFFTLLAHRYERRSILLTSNLIFSDWERIFKDPMTTVAAIDRVVHHSVILELNVSSYRMESAKKKQQETTK